MTHRLERETFHTSRLLEFCSEKELTAQTGHAPDEWPIYILKELVDNALDATEEAGVPPEIRVQVDNEGITVTDNGPGIPQKTVEGVLDFSVRVSSREAYVAPTRGAQGNALKTILPMPYVLDGGRGRVVIRSQKRRHTIDFEVDHIAQAPDPTLGSESDHSVRTGTAITVMWPDSACSILEHAKREFLQIADDYTWLNPHLTLTVDWFGEVKTVERTDPEWAKWLPSDPTSAHWYTDESLGRLVAAYLSNGDGTRTVRKFVSEFRGLKGSQKQKLVCESAGLLRAHLADLRNGKGLDHTKVRALLEAMQQETKPAKPKVLGLVGQDHWRQRFEAVGCDMDSFTYRKNLDMVDGVPRAIEVGFGYRPDRTDGRRLITAVNWSAAIKNPFRQLGACGESLDTLLSEQYVEDDEPVILVLHLACPRVRYADRGKSAVVID